MEIEDRRAHGLTLTCPSRRANHGAARDDLFTTSQLKALCEETYAELVSVIDNLRFLADYGLTYVHQIEVWKRRRHDPDYRYSVVRIRAGGSDFRAVRKSLAAPLESQAVILSGGEKGPYLNLDPFLVYEHSSGTAPDLFFYNGMDSPSAMKYTACRQGGGLPKREEPARPRAGRGDGESAEPVCAHGGGGHE